MRTNFGGGTNFSRAHRVGYWALKISHEHLMGQAYFSTYPRPCRTEPDLVGPAKVSPHITKIFPKLINPAKVCTNVFAKVAEFISLFD